MEPDFSGWATKANLECSDGRTIMPDAFKHQDKVTVPLVWSHGLHDVENILGHAVLTNVPNEGVRCDAYFNDTAKGQSAKKIVQHKDITQLSILATKLVERSKKVFHGMIREVSLVAAGANPGAKIDFIAIQHSDDPEDITVRDDEAIITTGMAFELTHAEDDGKEDSDNERTAQEVFETLNEEQRTVVLHMIETALEDGSSAEHSDDGDSTDEEDTNDGDSADEENTDEGDLNHQEGTDTMSRNVFDQTDTQEGTDGGSERRYLQHNEIEEIKENWKRGGSMKQAVEQFALKHGIENLDLLFPDPKLVGNVEFDKRRTEWVDGVINGTRKSPFSRIKTMLADITQEQARARGYIKGNLKKEEWFGLTKRTTAPTTVYKKQKLDRDDILDATELDVVSWMKAEMRLMLKEEIARAILIGDGRPAEDPANPGEPNPDKIKDPVGAVDGVGIRSILYDDDLYSATHNVQLPAAGTSYQPIVEQIMEALDDYKGSGSPTMYTTRKNVTRMLLSKDGMGRRLWRTKADLASELGVESIVDVEVFEDEPDVFAVIVNLNDYNVGTDKGGEVTLFDDFDLDYNKYLYLIETRFSGALVKIRSAIVVKAVSDSDTLVTPAEPTFDGSAVSIVDTAGVVYTNAETEAVLTTVGSPYAVAEGDTLYVQATPAAGFYFESNQDDEWAFTNEA